MRQDGECAVRCVRVILTVWTLRLFPHCIAFIQMQVGGATSQLLVSGSRGWPHPSAADWTRVMTAIISTLQICRSDYPDAAARPPIPID